MGKLRFRILCLGKSEHEKYKLVRTEDREERIVSPRTAVLIDHPDVGLVLYDTGDSDRWQTENSSEVNALYPTTEHIPLDERLAACGVEVSQIRRVVLSHLHFDHVGGLRHFSGLEAGKNVIVPEPEAREVFFKTIANSEMLGHAYTPSLYANLPGVTYQPVNGVIELAPNFTLFVQNCHTEGVIGMILKLADGRAVVFSGDTLYTKESYEKALAPSGALHVTDDEFLKNREIIRQMQKDLNAELFFGHDYPQTVRWEKLGWIDSTAQIKE